MSVQVREKFSLKTIQKVHKNETCSITKGSKQRSQKEIALSALRPTVRTRKRKFRRRRKSALVSRSHPRRIRDPRNHRRYEKTSPAQQASTPAPQTARSRLYRNETDLARKGHCSSTSVQALRSASAPALVERFDTEPLSDSSIESANFTGLVLFCIDAKFCK